MESTHIMSFNLVFQRKRTVLATLRGRRQYEQYYSLFTENGPQVVSAGVSVLVLPEVCSNTFLEVVCTQVVFEHSQYGRTLNYLAAFK